MQVRHVHARIHRALLRGSAEYRGHHRAVESEGVPAVLMHGVQRESYNVTLCSHLWRLRQPRRLRAAQNREKHLHSGDEKSDATTHSIPATCDKKFPPARISRALRRARQVIQCTQARRTRPKAFSPETPGL